MQPKLCLVVDDSSVIRKICQRMLLRLNFAVEQAEDGRLALACCAAAMPDFILLDWNMPNMGGLEFLRALRNMEGGHRPRVIFCTTENSVENIREAFDAGADDYIVKPFDAVTLEGKLAAAA